MTANRCYYALLPVLKSRLISRRLKFKIYKTIIRPIATYGSECWTLNKADERLLITWKRKVLRRIIGAIKENDVWRIRYNKEIADIYQDPDILVEIKKARLRWLGHLVRMEEGRTALKVFNGK